MKRRLLVHLLLTCAISLALAACQGATSPTPGSPGGGGIPTDLVGSWFTETISNIEFYDPVTGSWADPNGEGFYFIFNPDGAYEEGAVITQPHTTARLGYWAAWSEPSRRLPTR